MLKTTFTCNSLRLKDFFLFLGYSIFKSKNTLKSLFLNELADYFGIDKKNVFLFGAGRMGLYTTLRSLYSSIDDEVIVAGYTCVVVTNAVKFAGLKAVYVDVEESNLNISTDKIRDAINKNTRAIIVTHNFGIVYEDIKTLKSKFPKITIIEDAAHTFTSLDKSGNKVGLLGDVSFFSLEYSKPLTTGMGGVLIINNDQLCQKITILNNEYGYYPFFTNLKILATLKIHLLTSYRNSVFLKGALIRILKIFGLLFITPKEEIVGEIPKYYPVRLSHSLSLLGYLQLKNIKRINQVKSDMVNEYFDALKGIKGIHQIYSENYNYVRYPLRFEKDIKLETIEKTKIEILKEGIAIGEWFNDVVHPKGSYRYCYVDGICPIGESLSKRIINLSVNINARVNTKELTKLGSILSNNLT